MHGFRAGMGLWILLVTVETGLAVGSLTLLEPDAAQNGQGAWISGVTNSIRWSSTGELGSNLVVHYTADAGTNWSLIASNAPNTGIYSWSTRDFGGFPLEPGDQYRIRVRDASDSNIVDESDVSFEIAERFRLHAPNGGEVWYTGETNTIRWTSPDAVGTFVPLWVNASGSTGFLDGAVSGWSDEIMGTVSNVAARTNNSYQWVIPKDNPFIISESARVGISQDGVGSLFDGSDSNITIAGIRILQPALGAPLNRGDTTNIVWVSAGGGPSDTVKLELSENGGANWVTVTNSCANITGTNSFIWKIASTNPSLNAILRATDNQNTRIWGLSDVFNIADIDLKTPTKNTNWWIGETQTISWTQAGMGNSVNLYYSTNNFLTHIEITVDHDTVDFPFTNTFSWMVPPNPSTNARIKIESVAFPSFRAISSNFNIAGLLVESPNTATNVWLYGTTSTIAWGYAPASLGSANIALSYDGGQTYMDVTNQSIALSNRKYNAAPVQPTRFARVRMIATSPNSNRVDYSDTNFLIAGIKVTYPSNGALYTLNQDIATGVQFYSGGTYPVSANNPTAEVYYSSSGTGNWLKISTVFYNEGANYGLTMLDWTADKVRDADPSTTARIMVVPTIAQTPYQGISAPFTARGVRVTRPGTNSVLDIGRLTTNRWIRAGIHPTDAYGRFDMSFDGGVTFSSTPVLSGVNIAAQTNVSWQIAEGLTPSTNTVLRVTITNSLSTNDIGYVTETRPFTLRGTRIVTPSNGTVWVLGSTNTVVVQSVGLSDVCTLYYSSDGGASFDLANPLKQNFSLYDGQTNLTITLDPGRHPGTNMVLKVVSGIYSSLSSVFTVEGIKLTSPVGTNILALGDTNDIQWVAAGTVGNYTMDVMTNGVVVDSVVGITATNYVWSVVPAAVGTGVVIRITDAGGYIGYSEPFEVVDADLLDEDGDGRTAWEEYIADTDPTNPISVFQIVSVSSGPTISVHVASSLNRVYSLQSTPDVGLGVWSTSINGSNVPGNGGSLFLTETNGFLRRVFYRVRVDLP